ncbi:MAG: AraC family transcriptional regulator [Proteobacteria bacterium]|nr:AraC family transcriptional regulator [Pseudomonadota bacterium]
MDALSDVLRTLRLTGGVFLDARFSAPWSLATNVNPEKFKLFLGSSTQIIAFHYIVSGRLMAHVPGGAPRELTSGSLVLLPRNDLHVLGSEHGLKAVAANDIVMTESGLWELRHGGNGAVTHIVCGFLGCDSSFDPLISALPPLLSINVADTKGGAWIEESFAFAVQNLASDGVGAAAIVAKLSELMFVEALRRYMLELPAQECGWFAGLRDPAIGRALALMHAQPQKDWSAEELADAVNLSRSTFAERFSTLIGYPPIRYLIAWRMQVAARMLRETNRSIAQIAFDVGYDSEAAFNRAFRREFGRPPSAWRRETAAGQSETSQ